MSNPEQKVYELIYDDTDSYKGYGYSNHGSIHTDLVMSYKPKSVLDVGCGHNEFAINLRENLGVISLGIDFACKSADKIADILDLPIKDKEFDFITAWDVLEHLLEEQVDSAFAEMKRVSKQYAFTITCELASTPPPPGYKNHNLHQCAKPNDWWYDKLSSISSIYCYPQDNRENLWVGKWNE